MIIGNPDKFAILTDIVKEWSDTSWRNGIFFFCISGELFPKEILNVTFNSEVWKLKEKLQKPSINEELFNAEKRKAFIELCRITFPENCDIDNDYQYYLSPSTLGDFGYLAFIVSNGVQIRIMASKVNYIINESTHDLNNLEISETFVTTGELEEIFGELRVWLSRI